MLKTLLELTTCYLRRYWDLLLHVVSRPWWGQLVGVKEVPESCYDTTVVWE